MSTKDPAQDSALDRLVKMISLSTKSTVLRGIVDMIDNQEYTTQPIRDWCVHEIDIVEKAKEGL